MIETCITIYRPILQLFCGTCNPLMCIPSPNSLMLSHYQLFRYWKVFCLYFVSLCAMHILAICNPLTNIRFNHSIVFIYYCDKCCISITRLQNKNMITIENVIVKSTYFLIDHQTPMCIFPSLSVEQSYQVN